MEKVEYKNVIKVWKIVQGDNILESEHETMQDAGYKLGKLISLGINCYLTIDKKLNLN